MTPIDEEIISILSIDSSVSIRYLCTLISPLESWQLAQERTAEEIRQHCRTLCQRGILLPIGEDVYSLGLLRQDVAHA
jgi:hypothetical protein